MWDMHDGWGWWMVFGWLWFAFFWGGLIALVAWTVNRLARDGASPVSRGQTSLDIARERLARGEISEDEFTRLKQHLI